MKRTGGLFGRIADQECLKRGAFRALRGKRHRESVRNWTAELDVHTRAMVQELLDESYNFGPYRQFLIRDPKSRIIHAPPFRDRVLHHAIIEWAGPVFEKGAIDQSFACRTGKGLHRALDYLRPAIRHGRWFLKADISRYYDSISHSKLLSGLERRFREKRLLRLWERLLDSYESMPGFGLPIGALTSQFLGNFFLDGLDRSLKRYFPIYARYMDDLTIITDSRQSALRARERVEFFLEGLGLTLKNRGVINQCDLGLPFCGFVLYPGRVRLNRPGRRRLRRRWGHLEKKFLKGGITAAELASRSRSTFSHAMYADDVAWRRTVTGFSRLNDILNVDQDDTPIPGDRQEPAARSAGRVLEQQCTQLSFDFAQQEQPGQP